MPNKWKQVNENLTRSLIDKINSLPAPVKIAIGFLPGGGAATSYAYLHRWTIIETAEHYQKQGKLDGQSRSALQSYKSALKKEQHAYNMLLQALSRLNLG